MNKLDKPLTTEELDEISKTHDIKKDGQISFDEFKQIFDFQKEESSDVENQIETNGPIM